MIIEAIATGKTLSEAQEAAVAQLGDIGSANVEFEILAQAKPKTLGILVVHWQRLELIMKRQTQLHQRKRKKSKKQLNLKKKQSQL